MDNMSGLMNDTYNKSNQYIAQSYTYSHYYKNRRPYQNHGSTKHSPTNLPNHQKQQNSYKSQNNNCNCQNQYRFQQNTRNSQTSHQVKQNLDTPKNSYNNYLQNNSYDDDFDDNLLLNDVYGKDICPENFEKNSNNSEEKSKTSSSSSNFNMNDFSSLFSNFFQSNSNSENSNQPNNSNDFNMPDIETMLKFKKIFERLNSKRQGNDPIVNLLYAIKPFMQESKKSIIDQITKFVTISSALQDFNSFL